MRTPSRSTTPGLRPVHARACSRHRLDEPAQPEVEPDRVPGLHAVPAARRRPRAGSRAARRAATPVAGRSTMRSSVPWTTRHGQRTCAASCAPGSVESGSAAEVRRALGGDQRLGVGLQRPLDGVRRPASTSAARGRPRRRRTGRTRRGPAASSGVVLRPAASVVDTRPRTAGPSTPARLSSSAQRRRDEHRASDALGVGGRQPQQHPPAHRQPDARPPRRCRSRPAPPPRRRRSSASAYAAGSAGRSERPLPRGS